MLNARIHSSRWLPALLSFGAFSADDAVRKNTKMTKRLKEKSIMTCNMHGVELAPPARGNPY